MSGPGRASAPAAALVAGLAVFAARAAAQSPAPPAARVPTAARLDTARIDSAFARFDRRDSPGCALGVIRDGRLAYTRGYGMADLERGAPITMRTVFDIGSTSKQFTAASVVLLAADGRLSLDDDVRKYVPELPDYGTPITLRHLLHHTSGVRDYISLMNLAGTRFEDVTTDDDALAAIARQKALDFRPGAEHSYSNSGYFLASLVVKRASGKTLRDFARERIFAPLGMASTQYRDDHTSVVPDRATAYAPGDSGRFKIDMSDWEQTGDGAVHTTVEDLLRWDQNFYTPAVGGPRLLEQLQATGRLTSGEPLKYALGLSVDQYRGVRRVQHGGSWAGYRAQLARFPDQRTSVAVLCNLSTSNPDALASRVADVILAGVLRPAPSPAPRAGGAAAGDTRDTRDAAVPERDAARYVGVYFDERSNALRRVTADSGRLALHISGTTLRLRPRGGGRFETVGYPVTLVFRAARSGAAAQMEETIGAGRPTTYTAVGVPPRAAAELPALAGTYRSEELATSWTLAVRDGALVLRHRALGETRLEPAFGDLFSAGPALVRFTRGRDGRVTGFGVSVGRARNIGFVRRAE